MSHYEMFKSHKDGCDVFFTCLLQDVVAVRVGQQDVIWFENLGGDVKYMFQTTPHRIVSVTASASSVMFVDLAVLRPDPTGIFNDPNVVAGVQSANMVSYFTPRSKVAFVSQGELLLYSRRSASSSVSMGLTMREQGARDVAMRF